MVDIEAFIPFFSSTQILSLLDEPGRRRLLEAAEGLVYPDGMVVVQEGDPGDALFVIVEGNAAVEVDNFGQEKAVAQLGVGAFFGEMAVITSQPRSATVKAAGGDLAVLKIPKKAVQDVLQDYPVVREAIARVGIARTEETMGKMLED